MDQLGDGPVTIGDGGLAATIDPQGAQLLRLTDRDGRDLLWDGDPAWWAGRAPILFPVIGLMAGGGYNLGGERFAMTKHGFARDRRFAVAALSERMALFRLTDDAETRVLWPFAFTLDLLFEVAGEALTVTATIADTGDRAMPASFGFHPAFRWPLPYGAPRDRHRIVFETAEPDPIRRIGPDGLLRPDPVPSPVAGDTLVPDDALFVDDALILDAVRSRRLVYGADGTPQIAVRFEGAPVLGIWTKPGAPFLCIEPWAGLPDPAGYAGDLRDKPGVTSVPPGGTARVTLGIEWLPADTA
ncbi:MAG: aldose 1-epimerase family protein [Sphingomonas fennica]